MKRYGVLIFCGVIAAFFVSFFLAYAGPPAGPPSKWQIDSEGSLKPVGNKAISSITQLALYPQSLSVTTEANISLTGSLLLLTGDNDADNDAIDLQDGTVTGQILVVVGISAIDANDTITIAMTDTTCTGCLTVLLDEVGDTWGLIWTGSTWATISNSEVP